MAIRLTRDMVLFILQLNSLEDKAVGFLIFLPVFLVFLGKFGIVNKSFLVKKRKYALLIAFIVAAILTPTPDVVNQLLMAGPLILLYEVSIVAVALFARKTLADFPPKADAEEPASEPGKQE